MEDEPQPLVVDESGYSAVLSDAADYATYAALVTNPNSTWTVYRMLVRIDFYGSDDTFLSGEEVTITVLPGQTTALVGQSFGAGRSARIDIRPPDDTTAYVRADGPHGTMEFGPVHSEVVAGLTITSGTLTSHLSTDQTFLQLYAVYRSASGAIIGGAGGGVEAIAGGATVSFEIDDGQAPPAIAATEVYWQIGGAL